MARSAEGTAENRKAGPARREWRETASSEDSPAARAVTPVATSPFRLPSLQNQAHATSKHFSSFSAMFLSHIRRSSITHKAHRASFLRGAARVASRHKDSASFQSFRTAEGWLGFFFGTHIHRENARSIQRESRLVRWRVFVKRNTGLLKNYDGKERKVSWSIMASSWDCWAATPGSGVDRK